MLRAHLFTTEDQVPSWTTALTEAGLDLCVHTDGSPLDALIGHPGTDAELMLFPVIEHDMATIKALRSAKAKQPHSVFAAIATQPPSREFLAYAYREGLSDVLGFEMPDYEASFRLRRLKDLLEQGSTAQHQLSTLKDALKDAQREVLSLEESVGQWQQRVALLVAACRLRDAGDLVDQHVFIASSSSARRDLLVSQCVELGLTVKGYPDGAAVLEAAKTRPPDVLLADGQLPDMSVVALTKQLRGRAGAQRSHVIAWSNERYKPGSGIDDVASKSSRKDDLVIAAILVGLGRLGAVPA